MFKRQRRLSSLAAAQTDHACLPLVTTPSLSVLKVEAGTARTGDGVASSLQNPHRQRCGFQEAE